VTTTPARFCPHHRVPVGPRGCPRCVQAENVDHREELRAFWRWARWASVPVVLVGLWAVFRPAKPLTPSRLDPQAHRGAIETVESVLYWGDRLTPQDRVTLADGLRTLSVAIQRAVPSPAQHLANEELVPLLEITALEVDQDRLDVAEVRKQWEARRRSCFQDADWFRRSSPALDEAQASSAAPVVPPDADLYAMSLEQIRHLASRARTYVEQLPFDPDEVDGEVYDLWQSQKREIAADVQRVRETLPQKRPEMDQGWQKALRHLDEALGEVARICGPDIRSPSLVPSRAEGLNRAYRAQAAIRKAQDSIDAAPR
jgi:hypothetical protein